MKKSLQVPSGQVTNQSMMKRSIGGMPGNMLKSKQGTRMLQSVRSNQLTSSGSRKTTTSEKIISEKPSFVRGIQIYDEEGNDVTPLPLLTLDPSLVRKNQTSILGEGSTTTPSEFASQAAGLSATGSMYGGPFSRSVFTQSNDTDSGPDEDSISEMTSTWSAGIADTTSQDIRHRREEVKEILTGADLEKTVDLMLEETETLWMLDLPSVCVAADSEEALDVHQKNSQYLELCKSRVGNDLYAERGMTTFNDPPKLKAIQTEKIVLVENGFTCTNWDMYDTYAAEEKLTAAEEEKEGEDEASDSETDANEKTEVTAETDVQENSSSTESFKAVSGGSRATEESSLAVSQMSSRTVDSKSMDSATGYVSAHVEERIMKSESLKKDLFIMERVINLNTYQPKQALYRGLQIVEETEPESTTGAQVPDVGPTLDRLWSYSCSLTKGRNVSCLAWNKSNQDLIAVGYGQFEFTNQKSGLICCWSLKNPEYPERMYTSKQGVTALDFSVANANLLAAGFYDGAVAIYNVRSTVDEPVLDNHDLDHFSRSSAEEHAQGEQESHGKQMGPIWQIQWIEKERGSGEERAEVIIAISLDGRVTQWSIRKGFESYDIMKLKKLPTRMAGKAREKKGEAFISRHAGGLCFDFHPQDTNIYLAGTEDGYIHKCSCSYNEQYLETYSGHTAPVYRIRWSPFDGDIFLSCSADWSIRLWHQDCTSPILSFYSSTKQVHDVCWSPRSSTVFACVNEGAVEVWDLAQSILDAVISTTPTSGAKLTSLTFARNAECLLVGDNEGQATVYLLRCMPPPPPQEDQSGKLGKVIKSSLANQLPNLSGEKDDADDEADL